jgi:hypothetical protein
VRYLLTYGIKCYFLIFSTVSVALIFFGYRSTSTSDTTIWSSQYNFCEIVKEKKVVSVSIIFIIEPKKDLLYFFPNSAKKILSKFGLDTK